MWGETMTEIVKLYNQDKIEMLMERIVKGLESIAIELNKRNRVGQ